MSNLFKIFLILIIGIFFCNSASATWWNTDYNYYKSITINHEYINGTVTNHTLLINITDTDLRDKAQADGDDIVFITNDNLTQLDHQIESTFNSTTGHLIAWIRIPSINNVSDTIINMYYNNSAATNTENPSGVWSVNASGIWLMDEETGIWANDSSSNTNNGNLENIAYPPTSTSGWNDSGKIDGCLLFDGSNDNVGIPYDASFNLDHITISTWFTPSVLGGAWRKVVCHPHFDNQWTAPYSAWGLAIDNNNKLFGEISIGATNYKVFSAALNTDQWYFGVVTYDGGSLKLYVDGIEVGSNTAPSGSINNRSTKVHISKAYDASDTELFAGLIDSVHIYNRALAVKEIVTNYNNTNDPVNFTTFGTEQSQPSEEITITLISQTPSTIYQNSTGNLNISFGISHNSSGLNNTSVSFLFRNYDHTLNDANHSIRPPANNKCVPWEYNGQIMRAANRNESLNFEDDNTITGGDIYSWSGLDENQTRLTIHPINATYTIVNINGTVHDLAMEQMWYLDRTSMIESTKTRLAIHKSQDVLIKFWDAEIFKGNYDFIGVGYTDTLLGITHPSNAYPINYYKLNASYNPLAGIDPLDSPYIVYMGSLNAAEWVNHVYNSGESNYVRGMINNSYVHTLMGTTEIEYLYFTSETPQNKPYYINVTNDVSNTNRTFGETNVMWIGNKAPYTPYSYTPNCWFSFIYNNTSFDYKLYAADNTGAWNNSSLESNMIESGLFPPTKPSINHFHYLGIDDYDMNGNYFGNFTIYCGVSTDPDGGNVTHNLTLHYIDGTYVATINNTFTDKDIINNGLFINISFNSTPYYSYNQKYVLKLIATDDEGVSSESICSCSFSLGDENPPIALSLYLSIIFVGLVFMGITFMINIDPVIKTITSLISGIIFMLSGITMFTTDINTYHNANSYLVNTGWIGTLLILIGVVMCLYTVLIIYQIFTSEKIESGYRGHG